jgi:hypothetical protein
MDPSNPAMTFDTGIHRLETGVPLLVASEGDEPMKSTTCLTQKTNNAPAFKRLAFIYGFFAFLNIDLGAYGLSQLFTMLVLQEGESSKSTIVEQLSDVHHVLFWVHTIIWVTYTSAMYFLNIMLIRFGFDVSKEADDEEDLDTEEEIVSIYKAYFLLGCSINGSIMLLLSDWLVDAVGVVASCAHAAIITSVLAIIHIVITRCESEIRYFD